VLEAGAKANHLAYVGDSDVGAKANIGAGTITCNYDGFAKHRTRIGEGAFIGSNSALVAPVEIGAEAIVGAGSTIARPVAPGALALTRAEQKEVKDGARRIRQRQRARAKKPAKRKED
jgi:bifunctional UDP-N-acetylglucosamine pyrophosphorylase/glucosamine-1-phosphate N-acetyltransferase